MKFLPIAFLVALAYAATPSTEQQAIMVSYPNDTPASVMQQAIDAIKEAGGEITHEFNTVITGFSAISPAKFVDSLRAMVEPHKAEVEIDQVMSINNGGATTS